MDALSKKMYLRMNSNFQDELDQLEAIKANEFGDAENELLQNELAEMNGGMAEAGSFIRDKRESDLTDADSFIQDKRDSTFTDGAMFSLEKRRKSEAVVEGSFVDDESSSEEESMYDDDTPTKPLKSELNTIKTFKF